MNPYVRDGAVDWESYFRRSHSRQNVGFGTLLGSYTLAELKDLVAAKDATMRNLARDFAEVSGLPFDFSQFLPLYNGLVNRYQKARTLAQKTIEEAASFWRPDNMVVTDSAYRDLLSALNPRWEQNTWSSGDGSIQDISDQLKKFGATGKGAEPIPQPAGGSDVDITAFQKATQAQKAIEKGAQWFDTKHLIVYALVGGVVLVWVLPKLMAASMGVARMTPYGMALGRAGF